MSQIKYLGIKILVQGTISGRRFFFLHRLLVGLGFRRRLAGIFQFCVPPFDEGVPTAARGERFLDSMPVCCVHRHQSPEFRVFLLAPSAEHLIIISSKYWET